MLTTLGRIRSATLAKSGEPAGAGAALAAIPDGAAAAGVDSVLGAAARADWQASARAPTAARAYGRMDIDEFSSERRKGVEAAVSIRVRRSSALCRLEEHPACQPCVGLARASKCP